VDAVRRRRECMTCGRRFTTYERLAPAEIRVHKRDGSVEAFSRDKLVRLLARLARERPVGDGAREDLVRGLEAEILDAGVHALTSAQVADRLLVRLRELDPIMAARFASNYTGDDGTVRTSTTEPSPQLALDLSAPPEEEEPPARKRRK